MVHLSSMHGIQARPQQAARRQEEETQVAEEKVQEEVERVWVPDMDALFTAWRKLSSGSYGDVKSVEALSSMHCAPAASPTNPHGDFWAVSFSKRGGRRAAGRCGH